MPKAAIRGHLLGTCPWVAPVFLNSIAILVTFGTYAYQIAIKRSKIVSTIVSKRSHGSTSTRIHKLGRREREALRIRRSFGSGRVHPSVFFKSPNHPFLLSFFLSSVLLFLISSEPPIPQGGSLPPPLTCLGKNTGSDETFFEDLEYFVF